MVLGALGLSDLTLARMMDGRDGRVLAVFSLLLTPPFFLDLDLDLDIYIARSQPMAINATEQGERNNCFYFPLYAS